METPCKFIIAKLSIRKLGSSSVLILMRLIQNHLLYYCIMKCSLAGIKRHASDLFSTGYWIINENY